MAVAEASFNTVYDFNVVGVYRSQRVGHTGAIARDGHTVNHDERVVGGIQRGRTTHADGGTARRVAGSRSNQRPGTLPCSIWSGEVTTPRLISSALMAVTEPVKSFFFTEP